MRRAVRIASLVLLSTGTAHSAVDVANQSCCVRTIYLVRHGAYFQNTKDQPTTGGDLTPLGVAEARLVAARLRGLPFHFDSLASSTMSRARETALIIQQALPDVRMTEYSELRECTPPVAASPSAESAPEQADCAKRLDQAFTELFRPATSSERNDLLVVHGNVIRYFVMKALGVDTRAWIGMSVSHASLTVIRVRADGTMSVTGVGDVGHIPANMQGWGTDADPQLVAPIPR